MTQWDCYTYNDMLMEERTKNVAMAFAQWLERVAFKKREGYLFKYEPLEYDEHTIEHMYDLFIEWYDKQ